MASWEEFLSSQKQKPYFLELQNYISTQEKSGFLVFPPSKDRFNAFKLAPLNSIKVVILGQDPYFKFGQAHGLAFSVKESVPIPPSLKNIFKELDATIDGFEIPVSGNLTSWAKQGVLLYNPILTVQEGLPLSHKNIGWETFSYNALSYLNQNQSNLIYLQFGLTAGMLISKLDMSGHHLLATTHPSPLSASRGFLGSNIFKECNELLVKLGKSPIDWRL